MAANTELIAVEVAEIGAVVVRVILRAKARRAFGGAAGGKRGGEYAIDCRWSRASSAIMLLSPESADVPAGR